MTLTTNVVDQSGSKIVPIRNQPPVPPTSGTDDGTTNLENSLQQMLISLLGALSSVLKLFSADMENSSQIASSYQQMANANFQLTEDQELVITNEQAQQAEEEKGAFILACVNGGIGILIGFVFGGPMGALLMASLFVLTTPGLIPGITNSSGQPDSLLDKGISDLGGSNLDQSILRIGTIITFVIIAFFVSGGTDGEEAAAEVSGAEAGDAEADAEAVEEEAEVQAEVQGQAEEEAEQEANQAANQAADENQPGVLRRIYNKIPKFRFLITTTFAQTFQSLNPVYYLAMINAGNNQTSDYYQEREKIATYLSLALNIAVALGSVVTTDFSSSAGGSPSLNALLTDSTKARAFLKTLGVLTFLSQLAESGLNIASGVVSLDLGKDLKEMAKYQGFAALCQQLEKLLNNEIDNLDKSYKQEIQEQNNIINEFQTWSEPEFAAANAIAANTV